jgi:hypothetical protein
MKKNVFLPVLALAVSAVVAGCASAPIEQRFPERWEKTYVGMPLDEFKQVWPDAKYSGYGDLEQKTEIWTYAPQGALILKPNLEYFTFQDNVLIRYSGS